MFDIASSGWRDAIDWLCREAHWAQWTGEQRAERNREERENSDTSENGDKSDNRYR